MKQYFKQAFSYLMIGILLTSFLSWIPSQQVNADEASDSCLVLIEKNKGQWVAYTDLVTYNADKHAMIKAKSFAKAAQLTYTTSNKKKQFIIKNHKKYNFYTDDSNRYYSFSGSHKSKKTASNKAYYDKETGENVCQPETLASLCHYKSYSSKNFKYYSNTGYGTIICCSVVSKISSPPYFTKLKNIYGKAITVKQLMRYNSPDGKWSAPMYYMDGVVNGERKLWTMSSSLRLIDIWNNGESGDAIYVTLSPDRYKPLETSYKGVSFTLAIEKSAKENVTYTKENFGYMDSETVGYQVINKTHSGDINLDVDAKYAYYDIDSPTDIQSYLPAEAGYIKDFQVRFDVLDRSQGIVAGYIKFSSTDSSGNIVDVEGYFAESFKDNGDRPSISDLYTINNPATAKNKSKRKSAASSKASKKASKKASYKSSKKSSKTVKMPKLVTEVCPNCGGKGKIRCNACNGKGYTEEMGYRYGEYGNIVKPCPYCGGAGATLCPICGGSGSIMKIK